MVAPWKRFTSGGPFRLIFERGDGAEPGIYVDAQEASVSAGDTTTAINLFTDGDPASATALADLLRERVSGASAKKGVLSLSFENGAELLAPPDDRYESWTVVGDGRTFFCLPGGDVASTG